LFFHLGKESFAVLPYRDILSRATSLRKARSVSKKHPPVILQKIFLVSQTNGTFHRLALMIFSIKYGVIWLIVSFLQYYI